MKILELGSHLSLEHLGNENACKSATQHVLLQAQDALRHETNDT